MFRASPVGLAGHWFLDSGIRNAEGGVARFYRAEIGRNKPVSTEITGYTASALIYLFRATGDERYLDAARRTAAFLRDTAWNSELRIFPYEHPSPTEESLHRAFFFDSGIIVRGLIAVWRETGDESLIACAKEAAAGMLRDFTDNDEFHPVLELPSKTPVKRQDYWSGSAACYQAKSALAWWELSEIAGGAALRDAYLAVIGKGLQTHRDFLPGTAVRTGVMDRLHAYAYFLEALSPMLDREDCREAYRWGVDAIARWLRELAPEFARSDVYAQLLRARLFGAAVMPFNEDAAKEEAAALAEFQLRSEDIRLDGGFAFGRRAGNMVLHANPVSTAFALQALHLYEARMKGEVNPCGMPPI